MLGEEAQMLRKKANLTQQGLGARWQKSRQQIGRYERMGEEVPPLVADAYRGLVMSQALKMAF